MEGGAAVSRCVAAEFREPLSSRVEIPLLNVTVSGMWAMWPMSGGFCSELFRLDHEGMIVRVGVCYLLPAESYS